MPKSQKKPANSKIYNFLDHFKPIRLKYILKICLIYFIFIDFFINFAPFIIILIFSFVNYNILFAYAGTNNNSLNNNIYGDLNNYNYNRKYSSNCNYHYNNIVKTSDEIKKNAKIKENNLTVTLVKTKRTLPIKNTKKDDKLNSKTLLKKAKTELYNKPNNAISDLHLVLKRDPKNYEAYNYLGLAYNNINKSKKAIIEIKKAIKINPKNSVSYSNLASVYYKNHKYKDAFKYFSKASESNPKNFVYYNDMGFVDNKIGKYHTAIAYLNKAIRINPFYLTAYTNMASICRKLGENKRAAINLNKAGIIYFRSGNYPGAINEFKTSIRLNSHYAPAYENLGNSYIRFGKTAKASSSYDEAGNMFFRTEHYNKAINFYKLALKYEPNNTSIYHQLSTAYIKIGNMQMGAYYLRKMIKVGGLGAIMGGGL
ncbi:MAG: tetratricopeptide repeat protein [Candidatus Acididesulfobacter diazotrophicus]|jgi:tetratricopeptide (TPR) repeat protein|uniref:Tetratricopeptide repeat protein n=1 Tax=Candidatus Acididesulfobacter diazotrophicus TaxID=2597226 RepID=A0A519BJW9_9DELT|nr:MAG: tetratricopeptide repeat protein [Candidatus Acididesulfobacter diazotrophicus]